MTYQSVVLQSRHDELVPLLLQVVQDDGVARAESREVVLVARPPLLSFNVAECVGCAWGHHHVALASLQVGAHGLGRDGVERLPLSVDLHPLKARRELVS